MLKHNEEPWGLILVLLLHCMPNLEAGVTGYFGCDLKDVAASFADGFVTVGISGGLTETVLGGSFSDGFK